MMQSIQEKEHKKGNGPRPVVVGILSFIAGIVTVFAVTAVLLIFSPFDADPVDPSKLEEFRDFENYLSDGTEFSKTASTVMPSKQELADAKILYCFYEKHGKDNDILGIHTRMLCLTVKYSDEKFQSESLRLEALNEEHDGGMSSQFYLNGIFYKGFEYEYENGLAYHICSDTNTISYIAFRTQDLQYMEVKYALEQLNPNFELQIISYEDR